MLANYLMNVFASMKKTIPTAFATTPFSTNSINFLYNNNNSYSYSNSNNNNSHNNYQITGLKKR